MTDTISNSSPNKDKPADSSDSTISEFLHTLSELVATADQKNHLRSTYDGIFIAMPFVKEIVNLFKNWFEKKTAGEITRTEKKCTKRLFGSITPQQYYLVEGKSCLMGYLIPYPVKEPQKLKLPYYLGSLLDTQTYLHPKDPLLEQLNGVTALTSNSGVRFQIKIRQQLFEVNTPSLTEFAKVISTASHHTNDNSKNMDQAPSLRTALPLFVKLFQHSRPLEQNWRLLIPAIYERQAGISFRQNRDWIFIVNNHSQLISCYQLHGRNLFRFIWREYVAFRQHSRSQRIGNFELRAKKSNYCGVFKLGNSIYVLPPQTLKQFIEQISASRKLRDGMPARYTVGDCLHKFCSCFQRISLTQPQSRPASTKGHPLKERQYTSPSGWIFTVNHRHIITSCAEKTLARRSQTLSTNIKTDRHRNSRRRQ